MPIRLSITEKRHTLEYLRSISHLRPRTNNVSGSIQSSFPDRICDPQIFQERGFVYVHTPLITGSDCEGAGEMFQVTTMDLNNVPKNADGSVDYSKDFFGKETNLTVSGQLNGETYAQALPQHLHIRTDIPCGEFQHHTSCRRVLDDRAGNRICRSGR